MFWWIFGREQRAWRASAAEAISHPDVQARLDEIIHELKTGDGEHWSVGEAIERLRRVT